MTLQQTVSKIAERNVTQEEAMAFANENFGILTAFIISEVRKELENTNENLHISLKGYESICVSKDEEIAAQKEEISKLKEQLGL